MDDFKNKKKFDQSYGIFLVNWYLKNRIFYEIHVLCGAE